jgi:hypothetical protein
MAYDKKTSTISVSSSDPKVLERDLLSHFANVTEQVERDLASGRLKPPQPAHIRTSATRGTPMTWIAIVLNAALLLALALLLANKGVPSRTEDLAVLGLLFAAPLASLVALSLRNADTLLSLYLKRKALEEQKRIDQLQSK